MIIETSYLDSRRQITDSPANELVRSYFNEGKGYVIYQTLGLELQQIYEIEDKGLLAFYLSKKETPHWYDAKSVELGQAFFYKQALPIMTLLGALSLPYCYAATPGNKALYFSEKMRKATHKRLLDTADFIIGVCSPNSLKREGHGHVFINKIRLIHAVARYHISEKETWLTEWGAPINQEDMAGTNLAFSYLILKGMKEGGYDVSQKETDAFLHLWKYIGYQLHIDENLLANNYIEAAALEKAIRIRHFKPSEEGKILTSEIISYYKKIVPNKAAANLMESQIRYLLGPFVADCLGLSAHPVKDKIVLTINQIRKNTLFLTHKTPSYQKMLQNQKMLKSKFAMLTK